jgi:peptidoglycan hydrolase-like protein with peptidoglycan-binding domain
MADTLQGGSSGAEVQQLQQQLHDLGYQVGVTGEYDEQTVEAVKLFQQSQGMQETGTAEPELQNVLAEQAAASAGYGASSAVAEAAQQAAADTSLGQLSPDGQYRWDGQDWQPVAAEATASDGQAAGTDAATAAADSSLGQLSPDGQYRWDGQDWQPVEQPQGAAGAAADHQDANRPTHEQLAQAVASSITIVADGDEAA